MKPRTRARSLALQALYEIDLTGHALEGVLELRLKDYELEEDLAEFASRIVRGVLPLRKPLDAYIAEHAPEWPIDQVSVIDRNLIRMAVWEFAVNAETPVKVAINEAVELAKRYGSDSSSRFVNGVLGSLADRRQEIGRAIARQEALAKRDS
ncbi:MAG: transcription antitermination factor NusB [Anaerolineales bacterium]